MEWGSVVGTVTALTGLLTAIGGLLLAIKVILPTHKIVNQQRTDMLNFQATLVKTLVAHGIEVPEDQSKNTSA
jgi:hypothetical protein